MTKNFPVLKKTLNYAPKCDVVCHANESFIKEEKTEEIIKVNYFCIEKLKLIGENWQMISTEFDPLVL